MLKDLTQGPLYKQIFALTWPIYIGILSVFTFNFVDTYFVSLLGNEAIAALSVTFPIVLILSSFAFGLNNGASTLSSHLYALKEEKVLKEFTSSVLIVCFCLSLIILFLCFLLHDFVLSFFSLNDKVLSLTNDYLYTWYLNIPFVLIPIILNGVLRGLGNTKTPAIILLGAGVLNLIFDPLFIFTFSLGIKGAALASLLARFIFFIYILVYICKKELLLNSIPKWTQIKDHFLSLWKISYPIIAGNACLPLSFFLITLVIVNFGSDTIAAFGIFHKIEHLIITFAYALTSALAPIFAQSFAIKENKRIRMALIMSTKFILAYIFIIYITLYLFGSSIISHFFSDYKLVNQTLLLIVPSLIGESFFLIIYTYFLSIKKSLVSFKMALIRYLIIYLPILYFMQDSYFEVVLTLIIGNLFAFCLGLYFFIKRDNF